MWFGLVLVWFGVVFSVVWDGFGAVLVWFEAFLVRYDMVRGSALRFKV